MRFIVIFCTHTNKFKTWKFFSTNLFHTNCDWIIANHLFYGQKLCTYMHTYICRYIPMYFKYFAHKKHLISVYFLTQILFVRILLYYSEIQKTCERKSKIWKRNYSEGLPVICKWANGTIFWIKKTFWIALKVKVTQNNYTLFKCVYSYKEYRAKQKFAREKI